MVSNSTIIDLETTQQLDNRSAYWKKYLSPCLSKLIPKCSSPVQICPIGNYFVAMGKKSYNKMHKEWRQNVIRKMTSTISTSWNYVENM
jgi:hypothetical protein